MVGVKELQGKVMPGLFPRPHYAKVVIWIVFMIEREEFSIEPEHLVVGWVHVMTRFDVPSVEGLEIPDVNENAL
jgi:hypothetical protein